jgi:hypothetical protein
MQPVVQQQQNNRTRSLQDVAAQSAKKSFLRTGRTKRGQEYPQTKRITYNRGFEKTYRALIYDGSDDDDEMSPPPPPPRPSKPRHMPSRGCAEQESLGIERHTETAQQAEPPLTIVPAVTAKPTPPPAAAAPPLPALEATAGLNQDAIMHDKAFEAAPLPFIHPADSSILIEKPAPKRCTAITTPPYFWKHRGVRLRKFCMEADAQANAHLPGKNTNICSSPMVAQSQSLDKQATLGCRSSSCSDTPKDQSAAMLCNPHNHRTPSPPPSPP